VPLIAYTTPSAESRSQYIREHIESLENLSSLPVFNLEGAENIPVNDIVVTKPDVVAEPQQEVEEKEKQILQDDKEESQPQEVQSSPSTKRRNRTKAD